MTTKTWPLQEAKAKLAELVSSALKEPQIISRRGVPETVMMNIEQFIQLTKQKDIVSFFQNSPLFGLELDIHRDKKPLRNINL